MYIITTEGKVHHTCKGVKCDCYFPDSTNAAAAVAQAAIQQAQAVKHYQKQVQVQFSSC